MATLCLDFSAFGAEPNSGSDAQSALNLLLEQIRQTDGSRRITIELKPGLYDFYPEQAAPWHGGLSNHSPGAAGPVAFWIQNRYGVCLEGNGAEFRFHGSCFPFALQEITECTLRNFTIDFEERAPLQLRIDAVDEEGESLIVTPESGAAFRLRAGQLYSGGVHLVESPFVSFMTFEADGRLAYRVEDRPFKPWKVELLPDSRLRLAMPSRELRVGQFLVLRSAVRPNPAILFDRCRKVLLEDVTLHYAPGIGVLAQASEDLTLRRLSVCRRSEEAERRSTLNADATHFSGCRGVIEVASCRLEGMADDGINVHGTYLLVEPHCEDGFSLRCRFAHEASSGFFWGEVGDLVRFLNAKTMDYLPGTYTICRFRPVVGANGLVLAFDIGFEEPLPELPPVCGVENLSWCAEVKFHHNRIGNNRARGALFSTPCRVCCEDNCFDHTHGAAILISGDCNGWFESGACHDVTIRNNRFVNPLTGIYEFCQAVITIEPVIPQTGASSCFHSHIRVTDNDFFYFDRPLLWAKSVEDLRFEHNRVHINTDYRPFHPNSSPISFVDCLHVIVDGETASADSW